MREGSREKVCRRRLVEEGPPEKVCRIRAVGKDPSKEGPREKVR